jgi:hypothetical protein
MEQLRHPPRTLLLAAIALVAGLVLFAVSHADPLQDVVEMGPMSSLVGIGIGLTVAAFVLARVSARR